jgi:hypothetical protein
LKYKEEEVADTESEENEELVTTGLSRVEIKRNEEMKRYYQDYEIVEESEEDYEDTYRSEGDYNDGLKSIKLNINTLKSQKINRIIYNDSDEDIDPSDESESYDSEEDDYEDNLREEEYNDGILHRQNDDIQNNTDENKDSEDELLNLFEEETAEQMFKRLEKDPENIDPEFFGDDDEDASEQIEDNEYKDEEEDDDDHEKTIDTWCKNDDDDYMSGDSDTSLKSNYKDPEAADEYGDYGPCLSEEEIIQDHNPTELLEELEKQGDEFEDFECKCKSVKYIRVSEKAKYIVIFQTKNSIYNSWKLLNSLFIKNN